MTKYCPLSPERAKCDSTKENPKCVLYNGYSCSFNVIADMLEGIYVMLKEKMK